MTRKDYVAIAAALKEAKELVEASYQDNSYREIAVDAVHRCTVRIGVALAADNGRFDRDRFEFAAGFGVRVPTGGQS